MRNGLLPNSAPTSFSEPAPYVMLTLLPWPHLNGYRTVILEIRDPAIKKECFTDAEGLRWPHKINREYLKRINPHE